MQAGCWVDDGSKKERKGGANGGLGGQLGEEVGRHAVAALGALALHDQALLGEHVQALHQAAHGRVDGAHLRQSQSEGSQHAWLPLRPVNTTAALLQAQTMALGLYLQHIPLIWLSFEHESNSSNA